MTERGLLAHGHIFKNAGTTFDWALQRNFGDRFLDHRDDVPMRRIGAPYLADLLKSRSDLAAISSHHLCFPLPALPDVRIFPVYFLRHPLERVLSVYEFERKQLANTPGARNAKLMDLGQYVRWRLTPDAGATIRNYQSRYLAGLHTSRRDVGEETLAVARENMDSARVGLVERFDESLVELEYSLDPSFPGLDLAYLSQNVNRSRGGRSEDPLQELEDRLGATIYADLAAANEMDLRLHMHAVDLLARRLERVPELSARVEDLRDRCRRLQT